MIRNNSWVCLCLKLCGSLPAIWTPRVARFEPLFDAERVEKVPALLELLAPLARLEGFETDAALALAILPGAEPRAVDQRFDFSARPRINLVVGPWKRVVVFVRVQMLAPPPQGRPQALV